jgi:hypothetical protein
VKFEPVFLLGILGYFFRNYPKEEDVEKVAIINRKIQPNLAINQK